MEGKFVECVYISGGALYIAVLTHVDAQEGELIEDAVYGCKFLGMKTKDKKNGFHLAHHPRRRGKEENEMAALMNSTYQNIKPWHTPKENIKAKPLVAWRCPNFSPMSETLLQNQKSQYRARLFFNIFLGQDGNVAFCSDNFKHFLLVSAFAHFNPQTSPPPLAINV